MTTTRATLSFPVLIGKENQGSIENKLTAGKAYYHEDQDYYIVRFTTFPFSYYMKRNHSANTSYTLYSRKLTQDDGSLRFTLPVGKAYLNEELKSHLRIEIPLLRIKAFMQLHPC